MKTSKWTKWKIGAATAALLFGVFQYVKASPEFAAAQQVAAAPTPAISQPGRTQPNLDTPADRRSAVAPGGRRDRRQFAARGNGSSDNSGNGGSLGGSGGSSGNGGSAAAPQTGVRSHTQSRAS